MSSNVRVIPPTLIEFTVRVLPGLLFAVTVFTMSEGVDLNFTCTIMVVLTSAYAGIERESAVQTIATVRLEVALDRLNDMFLRLFLS